ncbi:uncharacterized protein K02A2.6-like [Anneissia japonica]|uniref:uncharacterized protein K02A2.6-like n=1 Tax=Anneissia japonica TaxID=1529436 RepID=UPI0014257595|nr:uncharacterized protein K02A2.6-like [Anneissia japonica]
MNTNSKTIYTRLDKIFSQFGYPENIISDNGPQLVSEEFEKYCRQYEILHTTSAPYHQAGNGRAERNIATVKQLLKKSRLTDINEILCTLRDTPIANDIPSPFTLMFGHRNIKTNLPAINNFGTLATTQYGENMERRTSAYGESHIEKQPPKINIGQPCRFQMKHKSIWQLATVVSKTSDRNYTVETPSGIQYTRDRPSLRYTDSADGVLEQMQSVFGDVKFNFLQSEAHATPCEPTQNQTLTSDCITLSDDENLPDISFHGPTVEFRP